MRNVIAPILLAATAFAFAGQLPRRAPEFVIQNLDGKQTLLSSYRGKTVVLALMFTTCPHCQKLSGELNGIQREYAGKGVQVLAAVWDSTAAQNLPGFANLFASGFPCGYSTDQAVLAFLQQSPSDPPFVPILVFIDKAGNIHAIHMITGETKPDSPEQKYFQNIEQSIRADLDKMLRAGRTSAAHSGARTPRS